jgi:hypothetical protein
MFLRQFSTGNHSHTQLTHCRSRRCDFASIDLVFSCRYGRWWARGVFLAAVRPLGHMPASFSPCLSRRDHIIIYSLWSWRCVACTCGAAGAGWDGLSSVTPDRFFAACRPMPRIPCGLVAPSRPHCLLLLYHMHVLVFAPACRFSRLHRRRGGRQLLVFPTHFFPPFAVFPAPSLRSSPCFPPRLVLTPARVLAA